MGWGIFEDAVNAVASVVETTGSAVVDAATITVNGLASAGEGIADVADGSAFTDGGWVTNLAVDVGEAVTDGATAIADGSLFQAIGDGALDVVDGSAFDKDGWITNVVEDSVPLGGFGTSIGHALAGNDDYAQMAAVKGLTSSMDFAAGSYAGRLNPMQAVTRGALGGVLSAITEDTLRDAVPESVRDQLNPLTGATLLASGGMGALGGGLSRQSRRAWNENRAMAGLGPQESKRYKFFGERGVSDVNQLDYDRALLGDVIDTTNPNGFFVKQVDLPGGGIAYDYPEWRQGWTGKKLFEAPRKTLPKMPVGHAVDGWQEEYDREGGIPGFESATMGPGGEVFPLYPADGMHTAFEGGQWELSEDSLWDEFSSSAGELDGLPGNVEVAVNWATQDIYDIDPWEPAMADESLWLEPPEPVYWAPPGEGMPEDDQMWQGAADTYEIVFSDTEADWAATDESGDWGTGEAVEWSGDGINVDDGFQLSDDRAGYGTGDSAASDQDPGAYYDEPGLDANPMGDGAEYDSEAPIEFSGDTADTLGTFEEPTDHGSSTGSPDSTDGH